MNKRLRCSGEEQLNSRMPDGDKEGMIARRVDFLLRREGIENGLAGLIALPAPPQCVIRLPPQL